MSWTVICPNSNCLRKLSLADAPGEKIRCPFCNQIFMVQRAVAPVSFERPSQPSPFGAVAEPTIPYLSGHSRKTGSWPVWLIGLLILESLISAFCGILIAAKFMGNNSKPANQAGDLNLKASGPSNFFYKPHSPDFMDDGTKPNEWWTKTYAIKDRTKGTAVSFKIFDDDVPDENALEQTGRMKLAKLFPEGRFQIQVGAPKAEATLAGEVAVSIPLDITPVGGNEGDSTVSKILVGELRICSRRGIAYWFVTWGPEGSKDEQNTWDKPLVFGNGRADWKPKSTPLVALAHESVKVPLNKSVWKIDGGETVKQLAESRPGMLAHAEGTIVLERKSKSELSLVSLEGNKSVERATGLLLEWQKILNGADSEAPTLKLEQFGEEGFFYKVIINQKTDTYLYLQETGTNPQYLLMGECRFEELSVWKTEFMRISKAIKQ